MVMPSSTGLSCLLFQLSKNQVESGSAIAYAFGGMYRTQSPQRRMASVTQDIVATGDDMSELSRETSIRTFVDKRFLRTIQSRVQHTCSGKATYPLETSSNHGFALVSNLGPVNKQA